MTPRPTSPITVWDCPIRLMDTWKARGASVLVGAGLEVTDTPAARLAWAAEAAKRGLWVVVDTNSNVVPDNLYAFLMPDEPDAKQADPAVPKWDGLRRDQLRPKYDAFKALAPSIPVFMSLSGDHITQANRLPYYKSIADCCDIWSEDWYIYSTDPTRYTIQLKAQAIAILKQAAPDKPVWSFIETSWQNLKGRPNSRQITAAEFSQTVEAVRKAGANGWGAFSHVFNGNGGWVSFDGTPLDVAAAFSVEAAKEQPQPAPEPTPDPVAVLTAQVAGMQQQLDAHAQTITEVATKAAQAQATAKSATDTLDAIRAALGVKP